MARFILSHQKFPGLSLRQWMPSNPSQIHFRAHLTLFLIAILLQGTSTLFFWALSSQEASKLPGILGKRDNDNSSSIASELYGTGVRLGIYLQSIGMIISYPPKLSKKIAGIGVQLAAATVLIAFLASWTILVREQEISSCEAWLVLTLLWALSAGLGVATTGQPLRGEYFVTLLSYGADIWAAVAAMWFWVDLSRSLPELGTKNLVFMFAPVDVTHWFRVFMIVLISLGFVKSLLVLYVVAYLVYFICMENQTPRLQPEVKYERLRRWTKCSERSKGIITRFFALVFWVFAIAASEEIIKYNDLSPETSFAKPGQIIPLVIGLIVFVDGILTLVS